MEDPNRADLLRELLDGDGKLEFKLVSDPGSSGECLELGSAFVDLNRIRNSGKNFSHEDFEGST